MNSAYETDLSNENYRAQAEAFLNLGQSQEDERGRAILLKLSQAWELLAGAWDSLSPVSTELA